MRAQIPFFFSAFLCLGIPARLLAYPADSLLLVHSIATYASGDIDTVSKSEYSRDNRGFWHERKTTYLHDSLFSVNDYTYNANRLLVATSISYRDAEGKFSLVTTSQEYDSQGRTSRMVYRVGDTLSVTYEFAYDTSGKLQRQNLTYHPPRGPAYCLFEYGASGLLHSARLFEADSLSATQAYAYDADGNMIRDVHLDSKGDTSSSITLEYDGAGRETRRVIVFDDRSFLPMDIRTGYDAMGKVDTVKYYEEHPQFKWFEVYTYRNVSVPVPIRRFLAGQKAAHPELTAFNPGRDVLGRADDASGFARARYPSHPGAPRN